MASNIGENEQLHEPVLLAEVIERLRPGDGGTFVDCTVGLGGHAQAILGASPDTRLIGIDRDLEALAFARQRLSLFEDRVQLIHANFGVVIRKTDSKSG